jgi:ABC-type multidrug transport system ATPase subunit
MINTTFGPYRIEELLGRGGMGEVYRAFDTSQNRQVALKCLLPHLATDEQFTERFRRESELAARLREPHVIPIHRYGEIDGRLFIDMRLVDGDALATRLREAGPLTPAKAVNVIGQVAAALDAAHADGLVHRDVKPSNVLLTTSASLGDLDFVYLVDFGIARQIAVDGLTATGDTVGSVDYMAPERYSGGPVDHRVDVYSLGCLLFECLTARKPFVAPEQAGLIAAHLLNPPPKPSDSVAGTPAALDEVVTRAMAKEPGERYPSAAAVAAAARDAIGAPRPEPMAAAPPKLVEAWWTKARPAATPGNGRPPATPATPAAGGGTPPAAKPAFQWGRPGSPPAQPAPPQGKPTAVWGKSDSPPAPPAPAPGKPTAVWGRPSPPAAPVQPAQPAPGPPVGPVPSPPRPAAGWWQRKATALHRVGATQITIGRAPECDVVLADLLVSRRHAQLHQVGGGWRIVDLNSWNGTYLNGRRINDEPITEYDVVGIGHALLRLDGGTLVEYTDQGDISFSAQDLVVTRSGKRLLDRVGFALPGRCLLAVVGPSGAGKSTLLGALTGQRPADSGQVRYEGRDLYDSYDELRQRIGLVPQDDILHPQLTVRRALRYAAQLRFPADTPGADRDRRVEEVIAELGLTGQAGQRISTLSGGQRKRTSVALELLTRPSLLFLDEPTSGLDPGMDKSVMQTLRGLADDGRTVVVVTHSPAQLELCDRLLVLASGGQLAYFGPPGEALRYFGQQDFADMFLLLDRARDIDWTRKFRESPEYARYVAQAPAAPRPALAAVRQPPQAQPRQQPAVRQFSVLSRRYLAVIVADRAYALFLLALPLVLAVFAKIMPGDSGLSWPDKLISRDPQDDPRQLLLVLVLGCAFMGYATSFRELVKERAIYRRERAIGLSPGAYLGSKLAVLGAIGTIQAVLLGILGTLNTPSPPAPLVLSDGIAEIIVALVGVTISIMAMGLLVSALIANPDRGMPVLVVVLLMQLLLCGMLFPVRGRLVLEQLSWLMPARWGFAMGAATGGMDAMPATTLDPLWEPEPGVWFISLSVQLTLIVAFSVCALLAVRGRRPARR